jgi:hypothetical protein
MRMNQVGEGLILNFRGIHYKILQKKMFRMTASKLSINILKIQSFYTNNITSELFWFQKIKTCSDCDTNPNDFKLTLSKLQILQKNIIST